VRFVTLNTFITVFNEITWDIHGSKPFTSIQGMKDIVAPMYDQGYSALIEDLAERGMLDSTLVANLAEFGRTPKVNPTGGRDHLPQCWTVGFAGGGVRGGRVVGKSDDIGAYPHRERSGAAQGHRRDDFPCPRPRSRNASARPARPPVPRSSISAQSRSPSCSREGVSKLYPRKTQKTRKAVKIAIAASARK